MQYRKGQRVRHPKLDSWGLGLVLQDSAADTVRIFWVAVGEKVISLKHLIPVVVEGEDAQSVVLDNLKVDGGKVAVRYKSLPASISYFLQEFPGGFHGDRYRLHERDHKDGISFDIQGELSKDAMRAKLDAGHHRAICDIAIKLTGARSNAMIFKSEKISLRDGLKPDAVAIRFAESLFELLHGGADYSVRFDAFADALEMANARKWTIATYFPFFMAPDEHMFVKPTITQNAADICAFDINYRPEVNSKTYRSVLSFSAYLKKEITSLDPRDMIDVQSFMWCIAPGTYGSEDA